MAEFDELDFLDPEEELGVRKAPGIKQYQLTRLRGYYQRAFQCALESPYYGFTLDEAGLRALEQGLAAQLDAPLQAVHGTLLPYLHREYTYSLARELAWKLAGNLEALRKGLSVPPYYGQAKTEWVYAEVWRTRLGPEDPAVRFLVQYAVYTGSPAGLFVKTDYPTGTEYTLARRFGVRKTQLSRVTHRALAGFLTYLKLESRTKGELDSPRVVKAKSSPAQQRANAQLMKERLSPVGCPYRLKPERPTCLTCEYIVDDPVRPCRLALRRRKVRG
jgi:hypothetical protein